MCGIVGVYGHPQAAHIGVEAAFSLQNRGGESSGLITRDNGIFRHRIKRGNIADVFYDEKTLDGLEGTMALVHLRYSTSGDKDEQNMLADSQPIFYEDIAIAHNGNLTNAPSLRETLKGNYQRTFKTPKCDSEVILQLASISKEEEISGKFIEALQYVEGAYSFAAIWEDSLVIGRDPYGFRPLALGKIGDAYIVASERQALEGIGAADCREVKPGELIIVNENGAGSFTIGKKEKLQQCIFELVYFANPAGAIYGMEKDGALIRKQHGKELAREETLIDPCSEQYVVIPVADSGVYAAGGYAREMGIKFEMGLLRSHHAGRSFIKPVQEMRELTVKRKHKPVRSIIENQKVIVVDDSLVRGTTSKKIVQMLRDRGAKEVHFRVASPPTKWPCYFGIDTPERKQLIASSKSVEEIERYINADSLRYLSEEGLLKPLENAEDFCKSCFTGEYPEHPGDLVQIGGLRP